MFSILHFKSSFGSSIILFISDYNNFLKEINKNQKDLINTFAQVCEDAIFMQDEMATFYYINELKMDPAVEYSIDEDSSVVMHSNKRLTGQKFDTDELQRNYKYISVL